MIALTHSQATATLANYQNMNYNGAVLEKKHAYDIVAYSAQLLGAPLEPYNRHASYKGHTQPTNR